MKRALLFIVAALALMVVPLGTAETVYSDPAGDAGIGPDITSVAVSNSDAGLITLRVTIVSPPESTLMAWLDTDLDPMTGTHGAERGVMVAVDASGVLFAGVFDLASGKVDFGIPVTATWASGVVTISVSFQKEALSINEAFAFLLATLDMTDESDESSFADQAPNTGFWTYVLTKPALPPPVKPLIGKPVPRAAPVAGRKFTVSFPITRSDNGQPLLTATAACKTTVAGRTVPHTHTFKGGTLKATVAVPRAAKGKQLKVLVKVTADTASTKVFTFRVR